MSIIELDKHVTLWLNTLGNPLTDSISLLLSNARVWFPAYAVVMGVMIWRQGWKKGLIVVASLFVTVLLTDQISAYIKDGIERLRPAYDAWMVAGGVRCPLSHGKYFFGFFSGHASNTFGFAIASYMGLRNDKNHSYAAYGAGVTVWAVLVCLSRVMLAAHYVGDILVGACFGLVMGAAVAYLTRLIIKRV
ncbi:MAG: phosphatase PAP2 family protein [Bacteroidales bacterium]|nr:phosphatase PAP2 family protein [Bacteroidales bacterium]